MLRTRWQPTTKINEEIPPYPDLPEALWHWLQARGVQTHQQVDELKQASLKNLTNPFAIKDMEKSAQRISKALFNNENICIYGDFDMDGTPAVAILLKGLKDLGFNHLSYYQPSRLTEGYGLHEEAIRKLHAQGLQLMVTVDLGVTAIKEAEVAKEIGLDLIITDHHLAGEFLPQAYALVNPNQPDCDSGLGYLAGTGVAFYLLLAVKKVLSQQGVDTSSFNPKKYLDLFALGTIADMVPLKEDNRSLVKHGLLQLAKTEHLGMQELLKSLELWGRPLHSQDVSMKLAPTLNALSRLELNTRPIEILICPKKELAFQLAQQAKETNQSRKDLQNQAYQWAKESLADNPPENFVFVNSEKFHKGVIGLVATKLMQDYNLPTFVGVEVDGKIVGSSRAPEIMTNVDLTKALSYCTEALTKHGGHKNAAGFELPLSNQQEFCHLLAEFFIKEPKELEPTNFINFDAEISLNQVSGYLLRCIDQFEPFGQGFKSPTFKIKDVNVVKVKDLRGGHKKLTCVGSSSKEKLDVLWFGADPKRAAELYEGCEMELIGELQWNYFRGQQNVQVLLKDLEILNSN